MLGSASLALENKLTETLLGRFEIIRAHHWDYAESSQAFSWKLEDYLKFGGYPAAALLASDKERWQHFMRESVIEPVVSRDISLLREIAKPALFRQTLALAMHYPAMEVSYQKLLGQLQDRGNATTVKSYLEKIEHAFLLKILEKYSTRPISAKSSSPKIVPLAPALVHSYTDPGRIDTDNDWRGRLLESAVGSKLLEFFSGHVYYWRERAHEVDFVVTVDDELFAIEVKSGRTRKEGGLSAFSNNFKAARLATFNWEIAQDFLQLRTAKSTTEFIQRISHRRITT